jgi:hypothetical protein
MASEYESASIAAEISASSPTGSNKVQAPKDDDKKE